MKKVLVAVVALILLAVGGIAVKFYALSPVARPAPDVHAPTSPEAIARGDYLANHITGCTTCHSPIDDTVPGDVFIASRIGAGRDFGSEEFPGTVRAPNLTPDKETGIGNRTDGEILRAMREGIAHDGHVMFPMMPYTSYANLSDEDALDIIAYVRTFKPIKNDPGPTKIDFPVSMFIRAVPKPVEKSPPPEPTEPVARGLWIMANASCAECHDTIDDKHQPIPGKHLAGGQHFTFSKGVVYAPNLTSDKATGIGAYTDEELMRVFQEGIGKDGRPLWVMPWAALKGQTEEDKRAVIAALRTIPPVTNQVPHSQMR